MNFQLYYTPTEETTGLIMKCQDARWGKKKHNSKMVDKGRAILHFQVSTLTNPFCRYLKDNINYEINMPSLFQHLFFVCLQLKRWSELLHKQQLWLLVVAGVAGAVVKEEEPRCRQGKQRRL